jgi:coproporphyrinogen III oxidase
MQTAIRPHANCSYFKASKSDGLIWQVFGGEVDLLPIPDKARPEHSATEKRRIRAG